MSVIESIIEAISSNGDACVSVGNLIIAQRTIDGEKKIVIKSLSLTECTEFQQNKGSMAELMQFITSTRQTPTITDPKSTTRQRRRNVEL
jgi:hypothetical protein